MLDFAFAKSPNPQVPLTLVLGGMGTRYKSAIDWWFYAAIAFTAVSLCIAFAQVLAADSTIGLAVITGTAVFAIGLPVWMLASTYYQVEENELKIRCGPFVWRVDRSSIHSIEPTRSPLSSPALSLNRLEIRYGDQRSIMVSPASRTKFIEDLRLSSNTPEGPT